MIGGFCVRNFGDKTGTNEENWFDSSTAFPHLGMVHFRKKTMVFMLEFTGRWQTIVWKWKQEDPVAGQVVVPWLRSTFQAPA